MKLTEHMLICLMEELAEIGQAAASASVRASKAIRFGLDEVQPGEMANNMARLVAELADLKALIEVMEKDGTILRSQVENKKVKLGTFLDYARHCGTLETKDKR